jgi:hypothetical protein
VTDWQLIPSALSYTHQLSNRVVGSFSILIPKTTDAPRTGLWDRKADSCIVPAKEPECAT